MGKAGTKHGKREIYPIKGGTRWAYKWPVIDTKGEKKFASRSFKTLKEAEDFKKKKDKELKEHGERYTWGEIDRKDAAAALDVLSVYSDISLEKAARFYRQHHPLDKLVTIEEAVRDYLLYRKPGSLCNERELEKSPIKSFKGFADKTYSDRIKPTFKLLKEAFGDRAVSSVMKTEIEEYFLGRGLVAETFNNKISDVKVFFDWCIRVKKCAELNPAASIDSLAGEFAVPVIYTVDEVLKVFKAAVVHDPQLVPFLALGAFAGIRTCEIKRMKVSDIDFEHKVINIRPLVAKSKGADGVMPRIIEGLPDAVWKWLEAAGGDSTGIDTKNLQKRRLEVFKQAGVQFRANAFRHSFATYG